jgi:hypothetical protein
MRHECLSFSVVVAGPMQGSPAVNMLVKACDACLEGRMNAMLSSFAAFLGYCPAAPGYMSMLHEFSMEVSSSPSHEHIRRMYAAAQDARKKLVDRVHDR